ncbi:uncharacterized protein PHACADRAFT_202909 [Phanerochaete carnosa HHB-10118-sp]|uniref:DUF8190 domain-containing protein n=1 Tax=Phanerochaete carnosa (strain HHB-10118-sp) TaxID=650164 RepID=K5VNU3_PHACS|nr:uncharacterized protein PHACADRAFT_202909 [Phanerochaete carnosa HHB-10118-sp]EKM48365.1 hypothetical protein PHACADRAFT_202909 [Phanerochaete carnosa HHB-10118-sp]
MHEPPTNQFTAAVIVLLFNMSQSSLRTNAGHSGINENVGPVAIRLENIIDEHAEENEEVGVDIAEQPAALMSEDPIGQSEVYRHIFDFNIGEEERKFSAQKRTDILLSKLKRIYKEKNIGAQLELVRKRHRVVIDDKYWRRGSHPDIALSASEGNLDFLLCVPMSPGLEAIMPNGITDMTFTWRFSAKNRHRVFRAKHARTGFDTTGCMLYLGTCKDDPVWLAFPPRAFFKDSKFDFEGPGARSGDSRMSQKNYCRALIFLAFVMNRRQISDITVKSERSWPANLSKLEEVNALTEIVTMMVEQWIPLDKNMIWDSYDEIYAHWDRQICGEPLTRQEFEDLDLVDENGMEICVYNEDGWRIPRRSCDFDRHSGALADLRSLENFFPTPGTHRFENAAGEINPGVAGVYYAYPQACLHHTGHFQAHTAPTPFVPYLEHLNKAVGKQKAAVTHNNNHHNGDDDDNGNNGNGNDGEDDDDNGIIVVPSSDDIPDPFICPSSEGDGIPQGPQNYS